MPATKWLHQLPRNQCAVGFVLLFSLATLGCTERSVAKKSQRVLRLATTTSMRDSGLLDELLPLFQNQHNVRIDVVAVGSGAALKLGELGDADVLLVHARRAEKAFMKAGHGVRHEELMHNYFVLLGPQQDPAHVQSQTPADALSRVANGEFVFVSRGDASGTHQRELSLWETAGGLQPWDGYLESGQGMAATIMMADEKRGYVLSDKGTFLRLKEKIELCAFSKATDVMRNPYAAIVVNPNKLERMNSELADEFVEFLIAPSTQKRIAEYQLHGETLFQPARLSDDS